MIISQLDDILNYFDNVKEKIPGEKYKFNCPVHGDQKTPDAELTVSSEGLGIHCHVCNANGKDVFNEIGINDKYLYKKNWGKGDTYSSSKSTKKTKYNLQSLARYKDIPVTELESYGLYDKGGEVKIPYYNMDGSVEAIRRRLANTGDKFRTRKGDSITVYGRDKIPEYKEKFNHVTLVEGESDCWTLWHHEEPALGIPGAGNAKKIENIDILFTSRVYIFQEPDDAGQKFVGDVIERLKALDYEGQVYIIDAKEAGFDDLSDLHIKEKDNFKDRWEAAKENAEEIELIEWCEPLPLRDHSKPSFNLDILPDWAGNYAESVAGFMQVQDEMVLMLTLSALSTALNGKAKIEITPGRTDTINLWTVSVLEPGARKSGTLKKIIEPINMYVKQKREETEPLRIRKKQEKELLEQELQGLKKDYNKDKKIKPSIMRKAEEIEELEVPPIPKMILQDVTPQALVRELEKYNETISIISDEGEIFKIAGGRYDGKGGANLEIFNKGWDGGSYNVTRVGEEEDVTLTEPTIVMGLAVQPQVFNGLTNKNSFKSEGFIPRFLPVFPEKMTGYRKTGYDQPPLDMEARQKYIKGLTSLLRTEFPEEPHIINFSKEALDVFYKFESELENEKREGGLLECVVDWGEKLAGNTARVAAILHLADNVTPGKPFTGWGKPISKEAMERAISLAWKLIPHAKEMYDALEIDENAKLAKYLLKRIIELKIKEKNGDLKPKDKLDRNVLQQHCKSKSEISKPKDLDKPLRLLQDLHYINIIRRETNKRGRNPSPLIKLNPAVLDEAMTKENELNPLGGEI